MDRLGSWEVLGRVTWVTRREGAAWTAVLVTGISAAGKSNFVDRLH
jgi:hypothetical protein